MMVNEKYITKFLFFTFLATILGFAFHAEAAKVKTRNGCLHLRDSETPRSGLYKTGVCVNSDTPVEVIGRHRRNKKYLKVIVNGQVGYMWYRNISQNSSHSPSNSRRRVKMSIPSKYNLDSGYRIRSGPSTRYRERGDLKRQKYELTGFKSSNGKWLEIRCHGCKRSKWIHKNALQIKEPAPVVKNPPAVKKLPAADKPLSTVGNKAPLPDFNPEPILPSAPDAKIAKPTEKKVDESKLESFTSQDSTDRELDSQIKKYNKLFKQAHDVEVLARKKEKIAEKRKNSSVGREAQREARQKRLQADNLLKKIKTMHTQLEEKGAKNLKAPLFIDLPPRNKEEAAAQATAKKAEAARQKKLAQEQAAIARAKREAAERAAAELAAKEKAKREAAELAAKEKAKREAAELAAKEKAKREAAELAAKEEAKREAAELAAKEEANRQAAELAAKKKATSEATEQAAREKKKREAQAKNANSKDAKLKKFERAARRSAQCFTGNKKLKASLLWDIMQKRKIPNPYGTMWKGRVPYKDVPTGACFFKSICSAITITTTFNENGTFTGVGKAYNSTDKERRRYKTIGGDKGRLKTCYYKGKVYIYSKSSGKRNWDKRRITPATKSWTLEHEQLGRSLTMRKVSQ